MANRFNEAFEMAGNVTKVHKTIVRERQTHTHTYIYTYIYIYMHTKTNDNSRNVVFSTAQSASIAEWHNMRIRLAGCSNSASNSNAIAIPMSQAAWVVTKILATVHREWNRMEAEITIPFKKTIVNMPTL